MKVKGYTIWELLISLVILSSIISVVYLSLLKSEKIIHGEQLKSQRLEEITLIQKHLDSLSHHCNNIFYEYDEFVFQHKDHYDLIFVQDSLLSIEISIPNLQMEFPIKDLEYTFLNDQDNFIKSITFYLNGPYSNKALSIEKKYSNLFLYHLAKNEN